MKKEPNKIRIDDLHSYLVQNKNDIFYVLLTWTASPYYAEIETDRYGLVMHQLKQEEVRLYARFEYRKFDGEYCFYGSIDDAIRWTKMYNHWDSCKFELKDGVIIGENNTYNPDAWEWPEAEKDLQDPDSINVRYCGYYYYNSHGQCCRYTGTAVYTKPEDDEDE